MGGTDQTLSVQPLQLSQPPNAGGVIVFSQGGPGGAERPDRVRVGTGTWTKSIPFPLDDSCLSPFMAFSVQALFLTLHFFVHKFGGAYLLISAFPSIPWCVLSACCVPGPVPGTGEKPGAVSDPTPRRVFTEMGRQISRKPCGFGSVTEE